MNKIIRTLVCNEEVSLIAMDTTEMVNRAIRIHSLSPSAAAAFGKALTAMTYMACWLKDDGGEISVNLRGNGRGGQISISGDSSLHMRGTIENPSVSCGEREVIGHEGYMTVIRNDGYAQPFVGTAPVSDGLVERIFMEYYVLSEQTPTFIRLDVQTDEKGECASSVGLFLQPLPDASAATRSSLAERVKGLTGFAEKIREKGLEAYVKEEFDADVLEERSAAYKCHCSRSYIEGVLLSMHKEDLYKIVEEEGKVNVHCHYCHKDYDFYRRDIDKLFKQETKEDR